MPGGGAPYQPIGGGPPIGGGAPYQPIGGMPGGAPIGGIPGGAIPGGGTPAGGAAAGGAARGFVGALFGSWPGGASIPGMPGIGEGSMLKPSSCRICSAVVFCILAGQSRVLWSPPQYPHTYVTNVGIRRLPAAAAAADGSRPAAPFQVSGSSFIVRPCRSLAKLTSSSTSCFARSLWLSSAA